MGIFSVFFTTGQQIHLLTGGRAVSIRGLAVVNERVIWVSGSEGNIGLSTDGGKNWKWIQVPGFEKSDFRDIEAFDDKEAFIMGVTQPAIVLKTSDGGNTWKTVFADTTKAAFLDAMDFSGNKGVVVGDPVVEKKYILESNDRGESWKKNESADVGSLDSGEAFFAASGSNVRFISGDGYVQVSGGTKSRLFTGSQIYNLLINQGTTSTGANSIAINPVKPNEGYIVGGDFSHDTLRYKNSIHVQFSPFIQIPPATPPHGYRSCVEYISENQLVCCGPSGVDYSNDGGKTWSLISNSGFYVCRKAKKGNSFFLAGPHGKIAMLQF